MVFLHLFKDGDNDGLSIEARLGFDFVLFAKIGNSFHLFVVKIDYLLVFAQHRHRIRWGGFRFFTLLQLFFLQT